MNNKLLGLLAIWFIATSLVAESKALAGGVSWKKVGNLQKNPTVKKLVNVALKGLNRFEKDFDASYWKFDKLQKYGT